MVKKNFFFLIAGEKEIKHPLVGYGPVIILFSPFHDALGYSHIPMQCVFQASLVGIQTMVSYVGSSSRV